MWRGDKVQRVPSRCKMPLMKLGWCSASIKRLDNEGLRLVFVGLNTDQKPRPLGAYDGMSIQESSFGIVLSSHHRLLRNANLSFHQFSGLVARVSSVVYLLLHQPCLSFYRSQSKPCNECVHTCDKYDNPFGFLEPTHSPLLFRKFGPCSFNKAGCGQAETLGMLSVNKRAVVFIAWTLDIRR